MKSAKKRYFSESYTRLVLIFIAMIFFPIFGYTIFQWVEKDEAEQVIESIYDRQLKSVLFAVNQHSWDVFSGWMQETSTKIAQTPSPERLPSSLQSAMAEETPWLAILVGTAAQAPMVIQKEEAADSLVQVDLLMQAWQSFFSTSPALWQRALQDAEEGYVRPTSVPLTLPMGGVVALVVFPLKNSDQRAPQFVGLVLDRRRLIDTVVAPKFSEMAEENLVFAVAQSSDDQFLYLSHEDQNQNFENREALWILPDLEMRIKLKGITLRALAQNRIRLNLFFLFVVNVLLVAGALFLIHSVQGQMRLAKMKTDFVASVSHELRTPLSLIQMYAEMLEMGRVRSKEKRRHYYQTIFSESVRLSKLINNILDFSRMESGGVKLSLQPGFLPDIVREALARYRFHLEQKGFALTEQLDETVPPILVNADAVTQAVLNLLDNAIKFSPDQKEIGVRLFQQHNELVLEMSDKGIGIKPIDQEHVFDKFYRGGETLVHDVKGSGLGLTLVKHIMQLHGGRVKLISRPHAGSVFQLCFPVKRKDT